MNAPFDLMKSQLLALHDKRKALSDEIEAIRRQLVDSQAEFPMGSRVHCESNNPSRVWVVTSIQLGWDNTPVYFGVKVHADGELGSAAKYLARPKKAAADAVCKTL